MNARTHALVVLLTLFAIGFILRLLRKGKLRAKYTMLWLSIGLGLLAVAASPTLLDTVSLWLGITYGPATFFLGAIALLFLIVLHFSWELSRLEERTRSLAEELALMKAARNPSVELDSEDVDGSPLEDLT